MDCFVYLVSSVECDLLRVGDDARVHVSQVSFPLRFFGHQLPESRRAGTQDFGSEHHHQAGDDGRPCGVRSCREEDQSRQFLASDSPSIDEVWRESNQAPHGLRHGGN